MNPPLDLLLGSYAAGTLSAPLHALVSGHLEISPRNRDFVAALEAAKGGEVEASDVRPLARRDAALAAIFGAEDSRPVNRRMSPVADAVFPSGLRRYLSVSSDNVPWRFRLPGVKEYRLSESDGGAVSLFWIRAGRQMPSHTHEGQEVTLVLRGGFSDPLGHYERGDIAIADQDVDHHPRADEGEDCICFAVTDAPLTLTGPVARLFRRIVGH